MEAFPVLAAFAKAAQRWDDPIVLASAHRIREFLRKRLWDGVGLRRAVVIDAEGQTSPLGKASLADYAYVAYGIAVYAQLSGDPRDRTFLTALLQLAWQRFHGPAGWRMDDQPLVPEIGRASCRERV